MPRHATTSFRAVLVTAVTVLSLSGGAAHADPPEGCVGLPSVPEAFVCITQWSPENAVPAVTPGPGQTVVVPEFCVFECVGPTPVTVPNVVVTQGDGVVAVIEYDGTTHTVRVPPAGDPNQTITNAVQTIEGAVATIVGAAETVVGAVEDAAQSVPNATFTATAQYACFGCGPTSGNLSGVFNGVVNGQTLTNAPMSASFNADVPPASCPLSSAAAGSIWIGSYSASFTWTQMGPTVFITFSGGFNGSATGVFQVPGNPCGGTNVQAAITGVATTT